MAKTDTTAENGKHSHQEDKMIVYVDELDEDYFDVTLGDAADGSEDTSDDESSEDEEEDDDNDGFDAVDRPRPGAVDDDDGLDTVDSLFKGHSTYNLTDDAVKPPPPVQTVSIKTSNTFTAGDRGILMLLFF